MVSPGGLACLRHSLPLSLGFSLEEQIPSSYPKTSSIVLTRRGAERVCVCVQGSESTSERGKQRESSSY